MDITLITSLVFKNNRFEIGYENDLLYCIKEDLKNFKTITSGHTVVMGYNTWISLRNRPLKNRKNIVITSSYNKGEKHKDVEYMTLNQFKNSKSRGKIYLIGGGKTFELFLTDKKLKPKKMIITHIIPEISIQASTFINPDLFSSYCITGYSELKSDNNLKYRYIYYSLNAQEHQEYKYLDLAKVILENGNERVDRTGTGTVSLFGTQLRFDISNSFPLLTTKRVPFKAIVEELLFFARGDSVTEDTPILLKDKNNNILIKQIKDIFDDDQKTDYPNFKSGDKDRFNKEKSLSEYLVWTDIGYSKIKKVIRHKVKKQIYRINTHCGSVDVTEDHSLFDEDGNIIKPTECVLGTKLLTNYPQFDQTNIISYNDINNNDNLNYSIEEKKAFIYGFFYGDGSCGIYKCKNGYDYSAWALNNSDIKTCNILKQFCEDVYSCVFVIYDTMKSSGVYKISKLGKRQEFVLNYRKMFYQDKFKIIPAYILNSEKNIKLAFLKGYYLADGSKKEGVRIRCDNKGKIGSAQLFYLLKSLGFNVSIYNSKRDIFRINCTFNNQKKVSNKIKKIIKLPFTENYVYDLETDRGRFQAGVGDIIVKNTDTKILDERGVKIWNANTSREFLDKRGLNYREGVMGSMYGWSWRHFGAEYDENFADTSDCDPSKIGGFDQLAHVEHLLKTDPYSRRIYISNLNPAESHKMVLEPCHTYIQFYVSEEQGEKHLSAYFKMRSNDIGCGFAFNLCSYVLLLHILALKCGMKPKEIIYNAVDCHIYKNHINQIEEQMTRTPRSFPCLKLDESIKRKDWKDINYEDFNLIGYYPHPSIKMHMAV